jgi:hypothetical protein
VGWVSSLQQWVVVVVVVAHGHCHGVAGIFGGWWWLASLGYGFFFCGCCCWIFHRCMDFIVVELFTDIRILLLLVVLDMFSDLYKFLSCS